MMVQKEDEEDEEDDDQNDDTQVQRIQLPAANASSRECRFWSLGDVTR
jgi:hypothetical protein